MPEWSGGKKDDDPVVEAESWAEAVRVVAHYAKDKSVDEFLAGMECPEPEALRDAAARAVAGLLAEAMLTTDMPIKSIPDPKLLVNVLCVGAMAGAVYAVSNMPNSVVKMSTENETTQPEEQQAHGTEASDQGPHLPE
jgi:hypothetical protein